MKAGFLAIHATRKAELGEEQWGLADAKASSWAEQMKNRLKLLNRHFSQASGQEPQPNWVKIILNGGVKVEAAADYVKREVSETFDEGSTARTQLDPESDEEDEDEEDS